MWHGWKRKRNARKVTSEMDKAENYWVLCVSMTTQETDRSIADYVSINATRGGGHILACYTCHTHIRFYARSFYAIGESPAREVPIHLSFCRNFDGEKRGKKGKERIALSLDLKTPIKSRMDDRKTYLGLPHSTLESKWSRRHRCSGRPWGSREGVSGTL